MPSAHTALLVIDVQPDFMPGGALACHQGHDIVPGIQSLLQARRYSHVVASQDWHPPQHVSFASQHDGGEPFKQIELYGQPQTLWPDHCVQHTPGAQLHPDVDWSAVDMILRKGADSRVDSYSAFRNNHDPNGARPSTGLAGWLRDRGVTEVHMCGLARDVCVLWSAQDARALGLDVTLLWPLTRPVSPDTDNATRHACNAAGIHIESSPTPP
ncbi:bifunctional nicotinamidase/pyrazinamidase [Oleiagrimonas sp. C23AA]|uniref:bifunctional nicotinamidase/pyrazinamidase n=1 Tax=Oleiagrimonas sp. C23AA TaxID=2719047 RepID=UPI00142195D8|nr:bifunctional nicotinamidase/pyrazinamidase [Oleiagrimonas sp. C23AA]NII09736.1 bifunctional nicotinamidase/pyrazinamidase [Oleiagrimonas sp. C23AA]